MDKRLLQTFAVWAKENLEQQIEVSLKSLGINSTTDIKAARRTGDVTVIDGDPNSYPANLFSRRESIVRLVREKGYKYIIEEFAYTWFNRLVALRFMEAHNYLAHGFRVLSSTTGTVEPDILRNLPLVKDDLKLDMALCGRLKEQNDIEGLFRYVLFKQCTALADILPVLFGKDSDYLELMLPKSLLIGDTVLTRLIAIPEENFLDDVQIVGWLYQYYNTEPKNRVFANLKKNIKISKHDIPAATQIFTPDWIVHYMVENSLGRLWVEGHPSARAKYLPAHNDDGSVRVEAGKWNYYLEEAEQEPEVQAQLAEIRKQYAALKPEDILAIDPCAGSGHILCVLFDVLVNIYEDYGYTAREAAVSIVQNNLWGLDIDDRAAQLAYFAVMMKARQYDRRFFSRGVQPHVYAIQESNGINREHLNYLGRGLSDIERNNAVNQMNALLDEFIDAKEYGSILQPKEYDWALLLRFVEDTTPMQQMTFGEAGLDATQAQLRAMIAQGQALSQKYHAVVTNPPYMSDPSMSQKLNDYIRSRYLICKTDIYAVFIKRCLEFTAKDFFSSIVTMHSWMFLTTFENLRKEIVAKYNIVSLNHLGMEAFEGIIGKVVSTVAFVTRNLYIPSYASTSVRLVKYYDALRHYKKEAYFLSQNRYVSYQDKFKLIDGWPIAYWVSDAIIGAFEKGDRIGTLALPRQGLATGDNERFLREWYEPAFCDIGFHCSSTEAFHAIGYKYAPYNKGGDYRKWYGNRELVIRFDKANYEALSHQGNHLPSRQLYFRESLTWSALTSGSFSGRYCEPGFVFDTKGSSCFFESQEDLETYSCFLNSKVSNAILAIISPTLDFNCGSIAKLPVISIIDTVQVEKLKCCFWNCVIAAKLDWDSFETSWDFQRHPLVTPAIDQHYLRLSDCWRDWERACNERFSQLKANEEELNRIFIDIYGLQDELTPEVEDKDVTVRRADLGRDIRSLISYLVGIVMGRYSLDVPGLAYAGGDWDASKYRTYQPDEDGIVPIYRGIGMDDGLTVRIVRLIKLIYGEESYRENMEFIAEALGKKQNESAEETLNRYLNDGFYADHLKVYQKRPIYWLFTSGKNGGFKCLIYMHRYNQDTLARINGRYFLPESTRLKHDLEDIDQRISAAEGSERIRLEKERQRIMACYQEALAYGQVLDHMANKYITIDLDDGVKVNYAKFQGVEMVTDSGSKVKMDLLAPLK